MTHFHVVHNVSGYLPESDVADWTYDTFSDARNALLEDMDQAADDAAEDDPERAAELDQIIADLRVLPGDSAGWLGYTSTHGDSDHDIPTAWQVVACTLAACAEAPED